MDPIDPNAHRLTSVSLRARSFQNLKTAQRVLSNKAVFLSEQEIFRGLILLYLARWRGIGFRTSSLRRYNLKGQGYVVKPLYLDLALASAAWGRAIHSGISISRMLDFAIRHYLHIFVELRLHRAAGAALGVVLNYRCITLKNSGTALHYVQMIEFCLPQPMPPQIIDPVPM